MNDLLEACGNLANDLADWYGLIHISCLILGIAVMGLSLFSIYRRTEDRRSPGAAIGGVFVGALMLSFTSFVDMVSISMFNDSAPHGLSTNDIKVAGGELEPMIRLAVIVVMLVGMFQVVKGLVMLKQNAEGAARFWPAVTHILGGVLCINIKTFMLTLGNTIGGPLQETIKKLLGS